MKCWQHDESVVWAHHASNLPNLFSLHLLLLHWRRAISGSSVESGMTTTTRWRMSRGISLRQNEWRTHPKNYRPEHEPNLSLSSTSKGSVLSWNSRAPFFAVLYYQTFPVLQDFYWKTGFYSSRSSQNVGTRLKEFSVWGNGVCKSLSRALSFRL